MSTAPNTPCEQNSAHDPAQQIPPAEVKFLRVLVRRKAGERPTSVSISPEDLERALKWAYGDRAAVFAALRRAALRVTETRRGYVSDAVRASAFASLRGAYQPAKAAAVLTAARDAECTLAEENNRAWDTAG